MRTLLRSCLFLIAVLVSAIVPRESNAFTPPHVEQLTPATLPAFDAALQLAPTVELRVADNFTAKVLALDSFYASEVAASSYASAPLGIERSASLTELLGRNSRSSRTRRTLNHLDL